MSDRKLDKSIEVYTLEEVADIVHVTRRTIYTWVKDGKIKAFKVGRQWRVKREELDKLLDGTDK